MFKELGELPIIAEDLGLITPEVTLLPENCGFPRMKVLQFAFWMKTTHICLKTTKNQIQLTSLKPLIIK